VLLFVVTALVFAASGIVAARLYPATSAPESVAERGLCTALVATAILEGDIYALGWSGQLDRLTMVLVALAASAVLAALSAATAPSRTGLLRDAVELVVAPVRLGRALYRVRSASFAGYVWLWGLALWTMYVSWLAPAGAWDGLWYHEPMVGFALQNRGFANVEVQPMLEMVNGYPRAAENLMLWASALYDRRLIDVVPSFALLVAALGVFTLARRHGASQPGSVGAAVVAVTIPGAALELRSTYVDLSVMTATVLALHFVSRFELRARDAWMAGLALGILGAVKANGAVFGAMLGAWLLLRALAMAAREPRRAWPVLASVLGGFAVACAYALPTYARNYIVHGNPLWPITYESELLGVRLEGTVDAGHMQRGFDYVWNELTGPPSIGENYHDTGRHAYGYALPFIAAPLLLLAAPALLGAWMRSLRDRPRRTALTALGCCLVFGLLVQVASPGHQWARFSLAFPATALVVIAWWLAHGARQRLEEGAIGAMLVLNALTLLWAVPAWDVTVREAVELASMSLAERNLADTSRCLLPADTRRRRDQDLGPGDVAIFTDEIGFVGNLWNDDFSNTVLYVPYDDREQFLARLDEVQAEWAYVRSDSLEATILRGARETWEPLGPAAFDDEIFVRKRAPVPEAGAPGDEASPEVEPAEVEPAEAEPAEAEPTPSAPGPAPGSTAPVAPASAAQEAAAT
jgi:hypothetical protein